ncbi:response regulator [Sphingomonas sp. CGMCC 1.13654]|uniref:Regulatory protein VirG n=1 Tax=Sphingomonas chungangi TaxID=2683589 RepID=A0A838L6B8_9SPHN|nr:response regulator [Sphingomonas chungangi]MBA2934714.1 response regulator [Sphingomonas chungangi]MVW58025.1 response regulator [Sphingomonas chungangi]
MVAPVADRAAAALAHLLVVDDDAGIRVLLAERLGAYGYQVTAAGSVAEMDRVLSRGGIDLILLDVMMPGEDGLSACRRLIQQGGPPVIILSALGDEQDRIVGLEIGADHYLSKPCSPREILAHVRALLRRNSASDAQAEGRRGYAFDGWRMDLDSHELFDPEGVLVHLSDGEFAVLRAFVEHPRRVLAREALLHAARGPDSDAFDRAIDVQVSRLRRKLRAGESDLIRTVRNEGYLFVPKVTAT